MLLNKLLKWVFKPEMLVWQGQTGPKNLKEASQDTIEWGKYIIHKVLWLGLAGIFNTFVKKME